MHYMVLERLWSQLVEDGSLESNLSREKSQKGTYQLILILKLILINYNCRGNLYDSDSDSEDETNLAVHHALVQRHMHNT